VSTLFDLAKLTQIFADTDTLPVSGTVLRASGLVIEASLPRVAVGTCCEITTAHGETLMAEVVGFAGATAQLMPYGELSGVGAGCAVTPVASGQKVSVGPALLGRVLDSSLKPIDGGPLPLVRDRVSLNAKAPNAMERVRISRPLETGVRAIDTLLTVGEGQRLAVMAGPGVGKSVLLGMLARNSNADVIVVGLIGERGREVREFIERDLGPAGLRRSIVVVATGDEPPVQRVRAAYAATAVAEYFRGRGMRTLLLVDSLSRVAMAQREIGLAAGEPPTSKGYPPSVFAQLPRLVERAGNATGKGSITAFYTCLAEGDDAADPVVDCARAALDGHLVLSRRLAESGHFPAIDPLASVSRVMTDVAARDHVQLARSAREALATYRESSDLIEVGAYVPGTNPRIDRAIALRQPLNAFLRQDPDDNFAFAQSIDGLRAVLTPPPPAAAPAPGGKRA
jgi:flagellum-specific ATP synthase